LSEYTEGLIKGRIAETIVEELLRDLGFYVLKLGQENTVNPLVQMKNFITACGGKFKLDYNDEPITIIRRLPDFVIVDTKGNVQFLEVKYREKGYLGEEHLDVFSYFPTYIVVVSLTIEESYFRRYSLSDSNPMPDEIKKSRFNVWVMREIEELNAKSVKHAFSVSTIAKWLEDEFDIDVNHEIRDKIHRYERLVQKWFKK